MYNRSFIILNNIYTYIYIINVVSFSFLDLIEKISNMSSFMADDVLMDIEKLETMLTNSSNSSSSSNCDLSSFNSQSCSPNSRTINATTRFTGSSKIYLRNLNKLLSDIEQKQKLLTLGGTSVLKRLHPSNSSSRSLTFTSLFPRPSIKCTSNNRLEPKTISFAQLITQNSSSSLTYSNHQSQYGCARLNEKMWMVHCREQLIKAVNTELNQTLKQEVSYIRFFFSLLIRINNKNS